jgi:tyrosine-specific transport protein
MSQSGTLFKGSLLVAGTAIGGGMLALPVLTSLGGFVPSLFIYFFCWAFMACTGLLMLEATQKMDDGANLVTMAEKTLGKAGKIASWGLYIFLFYSLSLAYLVGCGGLFYDLISVFIFIPVWLGPIIFLAIFAPIVYVGTHLVGKMNAWLMLGWGVFFLAFILIGFQYVDTENLKNKNWLLSLRALPIAFTAFAYQGVVPSLKTYLHSDLSKTRRSIIYGTLIALFAYIVWQWLILGIIPTHGEGGLAQALEKGETAVEPLKNVLQNPYVYIIGQCFAFTALVTSFLGVTIGLKDFLADGLGIQKTPQGRLILCCLMFIPVLLLAFIFPHVFLNALDFAGGFGCALLLGLMPILMAWSNRYRLGHLENQQVPGGKFVLVVLIAFVVLELACETLHRLGYF